MEDRAVAVGMDQDRSSEQRLWAGLMVFLSLSPTRLPKLTTQFDVFKGTLNIAPCQYENKKKNKKIKTMMFIRIPTIGCRQLALTVEKTEVRNNNHR